MRGDKYLLREPKDTPAPNAKYSVADTDYGLTGGYKLLFEKSANGNRQYEYQTVRITPEAKPKQPDPTLYQIVQSSEAAKDKLRALQVQGFALRATFYSDGIIVLCEKKSF